MKPSIEQLLGIEASKQQSTTLDFSLLFFSDIRPEISSKAQYQFISDLVIFGDQAGFKATYFPERHFSEFGSIFANPAILAANLIPQTQHIRFRTAGISLPLHHPAEVVEWWAMNDILSGGRIDLGFGSGWNKKDFIYTPNNYDERREICSKHIPLVQQLWRGETVQFTGSNQQTEAIKIHPKPLQNELDIWLLVSKSDAGFEHAGSNGYNVFTMLYGNNLSAMAKKVAVYRKAREDAGLDPKAGKVTLMLHTLVHPDVSLVQNAVEAPFKSYIKSTLDAHVSAVPTELGLEENPQVDDAQKASMLEYAYQRYFKTGALFGSVEEAMQMVEQVKAADIDEIACLMDFGVEHHIVKDSLQYLQQVMNAAQGKE